MKLWSAQGSSNRSTMPHGNRMTPIGLGTSSFNQGFTHQEDNKTLDRKLWYLFHIPMKARLHSNRMQPLLKLSRTLESSMTFLCLKQMAFILRGLRGIRETFRRNLWNVDLPFPIRYLIPNSPPTNLRSGRKTELLSSASSRWPEKSRHPRKSRYLIINLVAKTFRTYYFKNWWGAKNYRQLEKWYSLQMSIIQYPIRWVELFHRELSDQRQGETGTSTKTSYRDHVMFTQRDLGSLKSSSLMEKWSRNSSCKTWISLKRGWGHLIKWMNSTTLRMLCKIRTFFTSKDLVSNTALLQMALWRAQTLAITRIKEANKITLLKHITSKRQPYSQSSKSIPSLKCPEIQASRRFLSASSRSHIRADRTTKGSLEGLWIIQLRKWSVASVWAIRKINLWVEQGLLMERQGRCPNMNPCSQFSLNRMVRLRIVTKGG
jgi:hypothetical protein